MKPILLRIRKKTLVPTKNQITHLYRSDWKTVGIISKYESIGFFNSVKTDAQFALYLKNNYGNGIYSVLAFKKGVHGFYSFMKVECMDNRFKRLQKQQTIEEKENMDLSLEKRRLKKQLKDENLNDNQKELISDNLEDVEEDLSLNKDIKNAITPYHGCSPYLKTMLPIFKEHEYTELIPIENKKQHLEEYNMW